MNLFQRCFRLLMIAAAALTLPLFAEEPRPPADPNVIPVVTAPPDEGRLYPIAIIGAGAGGTMAVNRAVLNNNEVLLFTGARQERRRSRGNWVRKVDNIPGLAKYTRVLLELRNEMLTDLVQNPLGHNLFVIEDSVVSIEQDQGHFVMTTASGKSYSAQYVVLATDMMDEQPHIQGSIRPILKYANGQTAAYCALCDGHHSYGKKTVVIGHSESAANVAMLLMDKYQHSAMTLLTNGVKTQYSEEMLAKLQAKNITIVDAPIKEIQGNQELKQLTGFLLDNGDLVPADICYVALGVRPNNQLALQLGAKVDPTGLVIADNNGETSVPNLFVIGDLRSGSLKQIYSAWQQAVDTLQLINRRLRS